METYHFIARYDFESSYCNIVSRTHLYNDIFEYHITSKIGCDNILAIISKVKLIPLTYIASFPEEADFTSIIEILKNYINLKLNIQVDDVIVQPQDDNWIFTPYLNLESLRNYVYVEQQNSIQDIDLYPLINFVFVSTSEFTPFAHKKSNEPESTLISLDGVYLLDNIYEEVVDEIQQTIERWENNGTFITPDSEELRIFSQLWNIQRIDDGLYQSKEFDQQWIQNSLLSTKVGELPQYLVTGNWIFGYKHNDQNLAFISYSFLVYYVGLIMKNKSIFDYMTKIKVRSDLSIYANFGTYTEATGFTPNIEHLQGKSFSNLSDVLKTKILLDSENKNILTLIIPVNGTYWLVWNGATTFQSTSDVNTLITQSNDKILYNIISGNSQKYKEFYLNGIFGTEITSGLMSPESLGNLNIRSTLQIIGDTLYSESNVEVFQSGPQTSRTMELLQKLWNQGYFLSNWGITVYLYLGIINSSFLKIPTQILDLQHLKNYNLLPELISTS